MTSGPSLLSARLNLEDALSPRSKVLADMDGHGLAHINPLMSVKVSTGNPLTAVIDLEGVLAGTPRESRDLIGARALVEVNWNILNSGGFGQGVELGREVQERNIESFTRLIWREL